MIHSFWVPQLGWKRDAVPAEAERDQGRLRRSRASTTAGAPSTAALQHAWMRVRAVVEPREQFDAWVSAAAPAGRRPRPGAGAGPAALHGQHLRQLPRDRRHGRERAGRPGPDPPRQPRRRSAPASSPNTPENLRRWIRDVQSIKPGALMPSYTRLERRGRRGRGRLPHGAEVAMATLAEPRPEPIARRDDRTEPARLADDRRPQADRHPLPRLGRRLLRRRPGSRRC